MLLQTAVVALIVAACFVYAGWTLMPAGLRRRTAVLLLELPLLPKAATATMRRHAAPAATSGCACDGCDQGSKAAKGAKKAPASPAVQPIRFHPRPPR